MLRAAVVALVLSTMMVGSPLQAASMAPQDDGDGAPDDDEPQGAEGDVCENRSDSAEDLRCRRGVCT